MLGNARFLFHSREHAPLDSRSWTHHKCSCGEKQHLRRTRSLRSIVFGDVPICFVCIPCGFQLVGGSVCIGRVRPMDITDVRWDVTSAWQRTEGASSTRTHPRTSRIRVPTRAIHPLRHNLIAVPTPPLSFVSLGREETPFVWILIFSIDGSRVGFAFDRQPLFGVLRLVSLLRGRCAPQLHTCKRCVDDGWRRTKNAKHTSSRMCVGGDGKEGRKRGGGGEGKTTTSLTNTIRKRCRAWNETGIDHVPCTNEACQGEPDECQAWNETMDT